MSHHAEASVRRRCGTLLAGVAAVALCAGTARGGNRVPFEDSFESYADGTELNGTNGWACAGAGGAVVSNVSYTFGTGYCPYPLNTNHTRVMRLNTVVTNFVEGPAGQRVWIDMMVQPHALWSAAEPPLLDEAMNAAVYVDPDGHPAIGHTVYGTVSNRVWSVITNTVIAVDSWHRLTIVLDYIPRDRHHYHLYFSVRLDGRLLTHPNARGGTDGCGPGGVWFPMLNDAPLASCTVGKAGCLDDFVASAEATFVQLSAEDLTMIEGHDGRNDAVLTVRLSETSSVPVSVRYATADGTALSGDDYTAVDGTLTIPAGELTGEIIVPVWGDRDIETNETLTVVLSDPVCAALAEAVACVTIENDDIEVFVAVDDIDVPEGDSGTTLASFTVTLSSPCYTNVAVDYATADGTALAGRDYEATSGTLTIPSGATQGVVVVNIPGDELEESDTYFSLLLLSAEHATLAMTQGVCVVQNDDVIALDRFAHRMKIAFPGYGGAETLTNFPALVILREDGSGFSYAGLTSPDGADLRFGDAAQTRILNYDIEHWDPGGVSYVWVQVPELSGTGTVIWACWGNAQAVSAPSYTTDGSTWNAGYEAVWHLAGNQRDAGPAARHGVADGATNAAGIVAGCCGFDGVDDSITIPGYKGVAGSSSRTVSFWVNTTDEGNASSDGMRGLIGWGSQDARARWDLGLNRYTKRDGVLDAPRLTANGGQITGSTPLTSNATWRLVSVTLTDNGSPNVTDALLYVDGLAETVTYSKAAVVDTDTKTDVRLGCSLASRCEALLDEVRISSRARSADWLRAAYLTVASNAVFTTYGEPTPGDTDVDGIDDDWELFYFGDLTSAAGGLDDDWDEDGFCDRHEYLAGTIPTNPGSLLCVSAMGAGAAADELVVSWPGVNGKFYRIMTTDDLIEPSWTIEATAVPGVEPICTHTVTVHGRCGFVRVRLE